MATARKRQRVALKQVEKMRKFGYVTPAEIAERVGVDYDVVLNRISDGSFKATRIGPFWYVLLKSVAAYYGEPQATMLGLTRVGPTPAVLPKKN